MNIVAAIVATALTGVAVAGALGRIKQWADSRAADALRRRVVRIVESGGARGVDAATIFAACDARRPVYVVLALCEAEKRGEIRQRALEIRDRAARVLYTCPGIMEVPDEIPDPADPDRTIAVDPSMLSFVFTPVESTLADR